MRILLAGDAHGDDNFVAALFDRALRESYDLILQLGDLGAFWPASTIIDTASRYSRRAMIPFWFVAGNHENWGRLHEFRTDPPGPVEIARGVTWIDNGSAWTWDGVRFGALGGAFSVDWRRRQEGVTWWEHLETPSQAEALRLIDNGPLDVLVTHDAPDRCRLAEHGGWPLRPEDEAKSRSTRTMIDAVIETTTPGLVVHGHWHHRYGWYRPGLQVEGYGANYGRFADATGVLNIDDGTWSLDPGPRLPEEDLMT